MCNKILNYSKSLEEDILRITKNQYKYFFNKSNVVAVGLGYKIKNGFNSSKKCISIYVSKKISRDKLNYKEMIPKTYKGFLTDVIECGIIKRASLTEKVRPILGGYSIGPESVYAIGSYGCLVTDGKFRYLLSCNHVIAHENLLPIGTQVLQPSIEDGGKIGHDVVGTLKKYVPLRKITSSSTPVNYVDCGIAKEFEHNILSSKIALIGIPSGKDVPHLRQPVQKVGRTSARSFGVISSIGTTIKVKLDQGIYLFQDQIITTSMGEVGDSGSVLFTNNNLALGILCAVTQSNTVYNPINLALNSLNVKLVTN